MARVALLQELERCFVLGNGQPVGDAQGLHVGDPVDGKLQVAAGGLCQDDLVVDGHGCHSLLQQGRPLSTQTASSQNTATTSRLVTNCAH